MIKNPELLQKVDDEFNKNNKMTVKEKFDMLDSLYKFAYSMGKINLNDPMDNLETLIKTTKVFRDAAKTIS